LDAAPTVGKRHHHQEVDRQILRGHVDTLWERCAIPETSFQGRLSIAATRVTSLTVDGVAEPGRTCVMDWLKRIQFSDREQAYFVSFTAQRVAP
jgi:hypothetical protein